MRRLTLTHHDNYIRREVAAELGAGAALLLALSLGCFAWPGACSVFGNFINFAVFTFTHLMIHTVILAAAYRTSAGEQSGWGWGLPAAIVEWWLRGVLISHHLAMVASMVEFAVSL